MRDRYEDFEARGARLAAIGMGWPEAAAAFKREFAIPFLLLVDRDRRTYGAVGIRRGRLLEWAGPHVWLPWLRAQLSGSGQGRPRQDPAQLGGTLVVAPGGNVRYRHVAKNSADSATVEALLSALG